jgi:hypothetical protein
MSFVMFELLNYEISNVDINKNKMNLQNRSTRYSTAKEYRAHENEYSDIPSDPNRTPSS